MKNVSVMQSPVVSMTTQSGNHAAVQKTSDQSSQVFLFINILQNCQLPVG